MKSIENSRRRCLLVVEDQELMRSTLREYLQRAFPDRHVGIAADGALALQIVRANRPQLVFMDIQLPDADGIELTRKIRQSYPEVAVIVVTQHNEEEFVRRAHAAGAAGYVVKDRIRADLLPLARRVLGLPEPPAGRGS
ncbi:MAG: response regulator transcription factor [Sutterellaceae bacterium]|nr:response regulator transcription factor [Burkholderiaceae bacterium]MCX7901854.1 response regulator transcription factor [Burkholderiaceae bacterium]MDW8429626.1 response regulator transcription factor [Sutterellaceae bacterium]